MHKNVYIIGLGGIGSCLCEPICRFLNYQNDAGDYTITLIDGDQYSRSNLTRQYFHDSDIDENKAKIQYDMMKKKFYNISLDYKDIYLNEQNIKDLIQDNSIILGGVDNHKTRHLIQKYAEYVLHNVLYISGGNDYYIGDIFVYAKKNGEQLSPTIYQNNKDIMFPTDKLPDELGCDELVESEPQLLFTNGTASMCIQWAFYNYYQLFDKDIEIIKNDIKFDILEMAVLSSHRKIKK